MARGKINLQANDGAVIGLVVPDGLASGERQIALGSNLSNFASYHLIDGNLSVDNFVNTQGFNTTLYTGNGTTQSINTGIDMATQWGNDASETFGGLVWLKSRSAATNNFLFDTIRGALNEINSNTTEAQASLANSLTTFDNNGLSLGSAAGINVSSATYASWNFQTIHRVSGTTNHGKAYTCHYNPFTGFTIVKYEGSGLSGHEIPHHLGRKLDFYVVKVTTTTTNWLTQYKDNNYLYLNTTQAQIDTTTVGIASNTNISLGTTIEGNGNGQTHILYGWANSYFDESNKLIGNYEVGVYQGTGVGGNKVTTRGKPAWVMIKRLDAAGNWIIEDNKRVHSILQPNTSNVEATGWGIDLLSDGFSILGTASDYNTLGGQYLYMAVYDTNSDGGGSYYPKATDNANVQINNAIIPLAKGFDSNGVKNETVIANETITGVTWEEGKNYPYKTDIGYGKSNIEPSYGIANPLLGDFFHILENKWYDNTNTEIPESRNYMNHIVHADSQGNPLFVEELPKVKYENIVKADEFRGKNACTAWVNFDGTTTPPTIRDSYNVSVVIRVGTGIYDIYFKELMDNANYTIYGTGYSAADNYPRTIMRLYGTTPQLNRIRISHSTGNAGLVQDTQYIDVQIFGGRN